MVFTLCVTFIPSYSTSKYCEVPIQNFLMFFFNTDTRISHSSLGHPGQLSTNKGNNPSINQYQLFSS